MAVTAATSNPAATLMQDPGYARFMRQMGFDESEIQSNLASSKEAISRRLQRGRPGFTLKRAEAEQGVLTNFESRGMGLSSARRLAQQRADQRIGLEQGEQESQLREQQARLDRDAASEIARLRRDRAEVELDTRASLAQRSF